MIEDILYRLEEMQERGHSNVEIISTINSLLRYVNMTLINADSEFIKKAVKLRPKSGAARIPSDFAKVSYFRGDDKPDSWEFIGDKVYLDKPAEMVYLFIIPKVYEEDDEIDLPYFLFEFISRFAAGMLKGDIGKDIVGAKVDSELMKLIKTSGPIERPLQFYV